MYVLTAFVLLSTTIPLAFADDPGNNSNDTDIDEETQQQTEIMAYEIGAEIRLLQLEKAITKNINIGEEIVTFLDEIEVNTIDLQVILAEFELLLEDVQIADPNASDAVSVFVDLKHDAVNISKDFRETVRSLPNDTLQDQIQQRTRNMTCNNTKSLSNSIQNRIRQYNSYQFRNIFQRLGENGSEFINRYQNGSMTQNQVRQNITKRVNQTEKANQFSLLKSLKQQKISNRIQSQNQVQNASEGFQQRQENRVRERLERIKDFHNNPIYEQLMKRMQNKINTIGDDDGNGTGGNGSNDEGDNSVPGNEQDKPGYGDNGGSNSPGPGGDL